ncbi:MAG: hypothetical protein Q9M40_12205 [Sulfurimonas sp.]|nr:hypothetical protein [Sulfurimonas sp.]
MPKIDEIKSEIDWLKDLFKIIVALLVALVAGISKLYLDLETTILFYSGITLGIGLSIWLVLLAKSIKENIKELGKL